MYFHNFELSPLWKGQRPLFEQSWIPFTQGHFVPNLVEIGLVVLEKKMKMWKVHDKDNKDNDNNDHGQALGELKTAWCNKIKTLCML